MSEGQGKYDIQQEVQEAMQMLGQGYATTKRQKIWAKSGGRCWYCGDNASQIDHVNPVVLGGGNGIENLVPVCGWCNKSKRGLPLEAWRKKLSLKRGLAFTDEQRAFWKDRIPEDVQYTFWFEAQELRP